MGGGKKKHFSKRQKQGEASPQKLRDFKKKKDPKSVHSSFNPLYTFLKSPPSSGNDPQISKFKSAEELKHESKIRSIVELLQLPVGCRKLGTRDR